MEKEEEGGRERERARKGDPAHWRVADELASSANVKLDAWEREFLSSIRAKETLTKSQRESLEAIKAKAAAATAQTSGHSTATSSSVWIWKGTPQWDAWSAGRARPWPTSEKSHPEGGRRAGWYFPSEWPPISEAKATDPPSAAA